MKIRNGKALGDDVVAFMKRFGLDEAAMAEHVGTTPTTVRAIAGGGHLAWKSDQVAFEAAIRTPPGKVPGFGDDVLR